MNTLNRLIKLFSYIFTVGIVCFSTCVSAKNIGTIGQVYPINEIDFLDFIQSRALSVQQSGLVNRLQSDMQKRAAVYRDRPTPVVGLTRATEPKSWLFDPSIVLDHDVTSQDGKVIATQGTRVNPLTHISLNKTLIFYDADDQKETKWMSEFDKKLPDNAKIILVKGSLLQEEKHLGRPIYFDQAGRLVLRFGIRHVPAVVTQQGLFLKITEIAL